MRMVCWDRFPRKQTLRRIACRSFTEKSCQQYHLQGRRRDLQSCPELTEWGFEPSTLDLGLPRLLSGEDPACQCRARRLDPRVRKIPGSGRSPGKGPGNPLQYSCLGSPMDRGAWWATVYGLAKSRT